MREQTLALQTHKHVEASKLKTLQGNLILQVNLTIAIPKPHCVETA